MASRSADLTSSLSLRLLLMIGLALGLSLATAGLAKAALETALPGPTWLQHLVHYRPAPIAPAVGAEPAQATYDLGRFSRRYLLALTLVVFVGLRRWVPWRDLVRRGFAPSRRRLGELAAGVALAVLLVGLYVALVQVSGQALWTPDPIAYVLAKALEYGALGVLVAFVEESFFRAVLFRAMLREWGPCRALLASSAVFGLIHCISGGMWAHPGWEPGVGLRLLRAYYTDAGGSFLPDLRLAVGLFLLGSLLAYLYLRTGSLWMSVGLHSGVVLASKLLKKFLSRPEGFPEWLLGDYQFIVSGVGCWLVLLLALAAARWLAPRGRLYRRLGRSANSA